MLDPELAPVIREAFEMRLRGESINAIRSMLAEHGVRYTYSGVYKLLAQRVYVGEIHFGELVNLTAHEPIVDRALFDRVQRVVTPRDHPQSPSDRLLARQGILRCGNCDSRLVQNHVVRPYGRYVVYRCKSPDCTQKCSITASLVEREVVAWVTEACAGLTGSAWSDSGVRDKKRALETAQAALDDAMRTLTSAGLEGEPVAVQTFQVLRDRRDEAQAKYEDELGRDEALRIVVTADDVFEAGTLDEQRELIKAVIRRVAVRPGRGAGRIEIESR